jgi:outer membrane protein TolC
MTEVNRASARLGVTVQVPVFQGFRTTHAVQTARLTVDRLKQEQILLSEGVAMQVQETLWRVERAEKQVTAFQTSLDAATEHCDLTTRAYQHDLASTAEMLQAQLLEAVLTGQFYTVRYEHLEERARLEFLIGQAIDTYIK